MDPADDTTRRPLLIGNGTMPPRAEPYRTLRTSILLAPENTPQAILVASAAGAEGKTTTAINVAASLARCGASVLLIDGDLRLPRCHQALDLPVGPGLADFLAGRVPVEPIVPTKIENLSFLSAGTAAGNPAELLTSAPMSAMLRQVRERFNFIVIDSPPLLAVSDGYLLGNMADGVILVAERGRSRHDRLRMALQRLYETGAAPLGVVLNRGTIEREYYGYKRTMKQSTPRRPVRATGPEAPEAADA
jgi:succinoglycan biosynthesis transport protein ExoP